MSNSFIRRGIESLAGPEELADKVSTRAQGVAYTVAKWRTAMLTEANSGKWGQGDVLAVNSTSEKPSTYTMAPDTSRLAHTVISEAENAAKREALVEEVRDIEKERRERLALQDVELARAEAGPPPTGGSV